MEVGEGNEGDCVVVEVVVSCIVVLLRGLGIDWVVCTGTRVAILCSELGVGCSVEGS